MCLVVLTLFNIIIAINPNTTEKVPRFREKCEVKKNPINII